MGVCVQPNMNSLVLYSGGVSVTADYILFIVQSAYGNITFQINLTVTGVSSTLTLHGD